MKEFKGTKGKWIASASDRSIGVVSDEDDQSFGMIVPVAFVEHLLDGDEQEANANLIAAAPKLLALLIELVDIEGVQPGDCYWARKVFAAIDEALGVKND